MKSNVWIAPCLAPGTWSVLKALLLFSVALTPSLPYLGLCATKRGWVLGPHTWRSPSGAFFPRAMNTCRVVHLGLGEFLLPADSTITLYWVFIMESDLKQPWALKCWDPLLCLSLGETWVLQNVPTSHEVQSMSEKRPVITLWSSSVDKSSLARALRGRPALGASCWWAGNTGNTACSLNDIPSVL